MQRNFQQAEDDPIGPFEKALTTEGSGSRWCEKGPVLTCATEEESNDGAAKQAHFHMVHNSGRIEMGRKESLCSGSSYPPSFEIGFESNGKSKQRKQEAKNQGVESDSEQNSERSECSNSFSIKKVPQTLIFEPNIVVQRNCDEDAIQIDEELVEAQITWDLGMMLGLRASNEEAVRAALSKVHEVQDFVIPRKRGRLRKKASGPKK